MKIHYFARTVVVGICMFIGTGTFCGKPGAIFFSAVHFVSYMHLYPNKNGLTLFSFKINPS